MGVFVPPTRYIEVIKVPAEVYVTGNLLITACLLFASPVGAVSRATVIMLDESNIMPPVKTLPLTTALSR